MTLVWLRPAWVLALFPLALLGWQLWRRAGYGGWEGTITAPVLARLAELGLAHRGGGAWVRLLPVLVAAITIAALTGPARLARGAEIYLRRDPLILMLDLSPSVTGSGQRLADLQAAAATLLQQADGRPVGMLVYAADAFVASAPTVDARSLESLVGVLSPQTLPVRGSRPDIALGAVRELFAADGGIGGADIVMISDGGGAAAPASLAEASRVQDSGARLWALRLEAPEGPEGAPSPDGAALDALARAGGGTAVAAAEADGLAARMADRRLGDLAVSDEAPRVFRDLGRWALVLALVPAALLFRRRIA